MKEFRQVIPEGMQARVENGEVVYTPIEKYTFEIGDVIVYDSGSVIRIFEGSDDVDRVISSKSVRDEEFSINEGYGPCDHSIRYNKATPEQEALFNQKCLENGFWFDRENKKWIELKEGEVYYINFDKGENCTIIFKEIYNYDICDYSYCNEKAVCKLIISENATGSIKTVINISEATEEERQQLFDALKEKGKQWNAEKRCVENIKWKPEEGDTYFFMDTTYEPYSTTNELLCGDLERIAVGNCFKTEEECEKYAKYIKECSLNYKHE